MDLFVKGGTVVTMDAEFRVIEDAAVAIHADSIVAVGKGPISTPNSPRARRLTQAARLFCLG